MPKIQSMTPKEIVAELDKYIIGQDEAKKSVAIALRNRYRRSLLPEEMREEITPKNILMMGPTGCGKTEIARRLANDTKTHYMIGFIEISNFKMINDVFGRKFGKFTVKKIAEVLKASSSNKTLYGRLGDDSFGILIDKERFDEKKVEQLIETFVVSDGTLDHHVLLHLGKRTRHRLKRYVNPVACVLELQGWRGA